jgi:hypothetical protein
VRKSWKDYFKPGSKERESFDDLDAVVLDLTSVGVLQVNVVTANSPFTVQHTLKRVPVSFILTESTSAIILYATTADRANWTDKQIVLRSNTTGEIKLCVH